MGQCSREERLTMLELLPELSLRKRCELLGINRSTLYYEKVTIEINDINLLNEIRDIWLKWSFYGFRRITRELQHKGIAVNRKRVQRLMQLGGIRAIYPEPKTSIKNKAHTVYPYLLKDLSIVRVNQVFMTDITYLKMGSGFVYLVAIIDVYSRFVVGWSLSNTLDTFNCLNALDQALNLATPEILNSDQGCQFTSESWTKALIEKGIKISMTGKGRCRDNIYIERFWRSFKQEEFYLKEYENVSLLKKAISQYIEFYNTQRWHQSLSYKRPADIYFGRAMGMVVKVGLAAKKRLTIQPILSPVNEVMTLL
jgi:putative transposase